MIRQKKQVDTVRCYNNVEVSSKETFFMKPVICYFSCIPIVSYQTIFMGTVMALEVNV